MWKLERRDSRKIALTAVFLFFLLFPTGCAHIDKGAGSVAEQAQSLIKLSFVINPSVSEYAKNSALTFCSVLNEASGQEVLAVVKYQEKEDTLKNDDRSLAFVENSRMAQDIPQLEMLSMPFLFSNSEHMSLALNTGFGAERVREWFAQKNLYPVCALTSPSPVLVSAEVPLLEVLDYEKIRLGVQPGNLAAQQAFSKLGAVVSAQPAEELSDALGKGSLDAIELYLEQLPKLSASGEQLHVMNSYHILEPVWVVMPLDIYQSFTPKQKNALTEAISALIGEYDHAVETMESDHLEAAQQADFSVADIDLQGIFSTLYQNQTPVWIPKAFDRELFDYIRQLMVA